MGRIRTKFRKRVVKIIPKSIRRQIESEYINTDFYRFQNLSFAQEGEDLVLNEFLQNRKKGFYVDVGAHHPMRFSNTYKFYLKGWHGINIDAMPGCMIDFNRLRPRDINIEIAVSRKTQVLKYFIFNEPALNTFSKEEAKNYSELEDFQIIKEVKIQTRPLSDILYEFMPQNTLIDFMTIDIEGLELDALISNDWDVFKPEYLLVESLRSSIVELNKTKIFKCLTQLGYEFVAKTYNTLFFKYSQISKEL